jgi:hypothetical protein
MCRRTTCRNCHKPSWAGCGAHVEQVLADVEPTDRFSCSAEEKRGKSFIQQLMRR